MLFNLARKEKEEKRKKKKRTEPDLLTCCRIINAKSSKDVKDTLCCHPTDLGTTLCYKSCDKVVTKIHPSTIPTAIARTFLCNLHPCHITESSEVTSQDNY
ncbi:MAG: hypothetical protein Q8847_02615 [Sweet potato little leaf phytoplasma]|nr:hypothetical protein [Sweet potato little leaf phytoplasma]